MTKEEFQTLALDIVSKICALDNAINKLNTSTGKHCEIIDISKCYNGYRVHCNNLMNSLFDKVEYKDRNDDMYPHEKFCSVGNVTFFEIGDYSEEMKND